MLTLLTMTDTSGNTENMNDRGQNEFAETAEMALLVKIEQVDGQSLPGEEFNEGNVGRMIQDLTGVTPVAITLLNNRDVLIEFQARESPVGISQVIQRVTTWQGLNVVMACLISGRDQLVQIARDRCEGRKRIEQWEEEQRTIREEQENYRGQLTQLLETIRSEISNVGKKGGLEEGVQDISGASYHTPRGSPIVKSAHVEGETVFLKGPAKFPLFSGTEPTPKDEADFEQWIFQVKGAISLHRPESVRSSMVNSVRGPAREHMAFVGFDSGIDVLVSKMEERFGKTRNIDKLQQEFYQMTQEKGERIYQFASRLENTYKRLHLKLPDMYNHRQLKDRLFRGMHPHLKDCMRFMYKKDDVTYEQLLEETNDAELDSGTSAKSKSAKVVETDKGMKEIHDKIDRLTTSLKSAAIGGLKPKGPGGNDGGTPKKNNFRPEGNTPGTPMKSKGPETSAAGPFRPGQRPMQCYKCGGWGHGWRECPSKNVNWRELEGEGNPPQKPKNDPTPKPNPQ